MSTGGRRSAEILVAGAGPAGTALAGLLSRGGLEVLQLMPGRAPPPPPLVMALGPAARRILERAGIWQRLPAAGLGYFDRILAWDEAGAGVRFDAARIGEPACAWTVGLEALYAALPEDATAMRIHGTPAGGPRMEGRRIVWGLRDGTVLDAALLVAADGAGSRVRELCGIPVRVRSYRQRAVVCTARCSGTHGHVAMQAFLQAGPAAALPMAQPDRVAVIWSTESGHARRLEALAGRGFARELESVFGFRLGTIECAPRRAFPLTALCAESYRSARVALVGDAAHVVHPLAGLGMNLGLQDAAALAELIMDACRRGRDPGSPALLDRYQRWRRPINRMTALAIDSLGALFRSERLAGLRGLGLDLLQRHESCKLPFMLAAAGQCGGAPAAARPLPP